MSVELNGALPADTGEISDLGAGDMSDIIFAVAAYQLASLDEDLAARVLGLKHMTEVKASYRERIAALQEALKDIPEGEDSTWIDEDLATHASFGWNDAEGSVTDMGEGNISSTGRRREEFGDGDGGSGSGGSGEVGGSGGYAMTSRSGSPGWPATGGIGEAEQAFDEEPPPANIEVNVTSDDLNTEILRLQGELDQLSGEGEIELLAINRLLNRRNQVLQLASNVMSSVHQSSMGIISNIK